MALSGERGQQSCRDCRNGAASRSDLPAKVVRTARQDAGSVAGLLVTTEAMVAEKPKPNAGPMPHGAGGMGDMVTSSASDPRNGEGRSQRRPALIDVALAST